MFIITGFYFGDPLLYDLLGGHAHRYGLISLNVRLVVIAK